MPHSTGLTHELRHTYKLLSSVPYISTSTLQPHQKTCSICHEDFDDASIWTAEGTMNRPVRLSCGRMHTLSFTKDSSLEDPCRMAYPYADVFLWTDTYGLQCLTRWAFSLHFNNKCAYCQTPIINPTSTNINTNQKEWAQCHDLLFEILTCEHDTPAERNFCIIERQKGKSEELGPVLYK